MASAVTLFLYGGISMDYSGKPAKFSEWDPLNMIKLKAIETIFTKLYTL